jgi:hypothetical protein
MWIEKAKERKKMGCGGLSCEEKGTAWAGTRPFFCFTSYFILLILHHLILQSKALL